MVATSSASERDDPYTVRTASLIKAAMERPVRADSASSKSRSSAVSEICVRSMM